MQLVKMNINTENVAWHVNPRWRIGTKDLIVMDTHVQKNKQQNKTGCEGSKVIMRLL